MELKADITANEVGAYSKGDADKRFQPVGKYQVEGYSYSKAETDTKYQPKGNYAPAGNYANKGDSYTKAESEGKFQPKGSYQPSGNYATKGESYTKAESDSKYQGKGNYQAAGYSYSKSEADNKYQAKGNYVATTRKVNDKPLSGDVTITSQDIFNGQAISIGANQNLNNYKTAGIYFQPANANATTNLNYPEAMAGTLIVLKNAGITQLYYVYNTSRIYSRSQYGTGGFTPWAKEFNSQNKPTAGDVGAYSKGESDGKYQPKGNYLASGYSYSKGESDGKYQPKGNYLTSGYSYSKGESDNKYQPKGNYAIAGSSYTKAESDNRFSKYKVTGWKELYNGDWLSDNGVNINEDIRGKIVWVDLGGSQWTSFIMPPVDNIPMWCGHSDNNWCTFKTSNNGKRIHRAFGKGNTGIVRVFVAS
ncbi:pyocin knob domain-containing protein [Proteus cibi]|uniref:pyocin knob domain-containing protein n=1 Tax=Proteus cibi TaxID=2050966 RepID=UPI00398B29AA